MAQGGDNSFVLAPDTDQNLTQSQLNQEVTNGDILPTDELSPQSQLETNDQVDPLSVEEQDETAEDDQDENDAQGDDDEVNDGEDNPAHLASSSPDGKHTPVGEELEQEEQDMVQTEDEAKYSMIDNYICNDLYDRLKAFQMHAQTQGDLEEILDARINCLSLSKVLVTIHNKSLFLVVIAHTELGEAYLALKRYHQALDHLSQALKLNGQLFQQMKETREYQTYILNRLGQCYCNAGNYRDSLSLLERSLTLNQQIKGESDSSNCEIFQIMSKVYIKMRDYDQSVKLLRKMMFLSSEAYGESSEQVGNVHLQLAKIHAKRRDVAGATVEQAEAQRIYESLEKYQGTDFIAGIATQLSTWQEQTGQIAEALVNLQKALEIYERSYGMQDVRTCKIKRNIALVYIRGSDFEDALRELKEVESLERELYGESSAQLAKTQKIIGILMIIMRNNADPKSIGPVISADEAREYLMQAHAIFEQRGMMKQLRETKQKIKLLQQTLKNPAQALVENEIDEIAQSDKEEQEGLVASKCRDQMDGISPQEGAIDDDEQAMGENAATFAPMHKELFSQAAINTQGGKKGKKGKKSKKGNASGNYVMSSKTANVLKNNFLK